MSNNRIILKIIVFFNLLLFIGCKQQVKDLTKDLTLEDKIVIAVASRKIPVPNEQKVAFDALNWPFDIGPQNTEVFSNLEHYLPTALIEKGTTETKPLPKNISITLGQEILTSNFFKKETSLNQICEEKQIDGVIVLHKGEIVYEKYPDMDPSDRHLLASVSKTFVATIIATLADKNVLDEQDNIGKFLPEFKDKPLANVTIENLLRMASGIDCKEKEKGAFTDPNHCFYKLLQHTAVFPQPTTDFEENLIKIIADEGTYEKQGKVLDYTSANSVILATIAERATSKPYHELVQEYIWSKIGAEADARISLSSTGFTGSYGIMLMRLRDVARYGLAYTEDATTKIASERYLSKIRNGDEELFRAEGGFAERTWLPFLEEQGPLFQSYHWDVVFEDGDFVKFGLGGQGLYVSPKKRLVIAFFSSYKNETRNSNNMRYLVRSLALLEHFKK